MFFFLYISVLTSTLHSPHAPLYCSRHTTRHRTVRNVNEMSPHGARPTTLHVQASLHLRTLVKLRIRVSLPDPIIGLSKRFLRSQSSGWHSRAVLGQAADVELGEEGHSLEPQFKGSWSDSTGWQYWLKSETGVPSQTDFAPLRQSVAHFGFFSSTAKI